MTPSFLFKTGIFIQFLMSLLKYSKIIVYIYLKVSYEVFAFIYIEIQVFSLYSN